MIQYLQHLDTVGIHAIQAIGSWAYYPAWFFSYVVGMPEVMPILVVAFFLLTGKRRASIEAFVVFVASGAAVLILKHFIQAPRPGAVDSSIVQYVVETNSGMPSGHALISLSILGWIWLKGRKSWGSASRLVSVVLWSLVFFIGLSRVYLGVHYPSQVLAGWGIGALMLVVLWQIDIRFFSGRNR
jgi:undecaprenyl-diphosphatase